MSRVARRVLLWLARNPWLKARVPRLPFMRRAVRRFMPGETVDAAVSAGIALRDAGIPTIYTRLGENISELAEADAVAEHYGGLIDRLAAEGLDGEPSVKLTQLGLDVDEEACHGHLARLASAAAGHERVLWIDMEDSSYVERTIRLYERLRADGHARTGICLQAYLHRTAADVERLLPLGPAVRLVKGAYDEPRSVALHSKADVDANFLALSVTLLRATREGSVRVGLGTHDTRLVERIAAHVSAAGIGRDAFEVQMLYGIRVGEQHRLVREGYRVRTLIAYGEHWYPWYMRRLAERPANVAFALRQLLP